MARSSSFGEKRKARVTQTDSTVLGLILYGLYSPHPQTCDWHGASKMFDKTRIHGMPHVSTPQISVPRPGSCFLPCPCFSLVSISMLRSQTPVLRNTIGKQDTIWYNDWRTLLQYAVYLSFKFILKPVHMQEAFSPCLLKVLCTVGSRECIGQGGSPSYCSPAYVYLIQFMQCPFLWISWTPASSTPTSTL